MRKIDRLIGARVRDRRIELGLAQQALADLLGVTRQYVDQLERGVSAFSDARLELVARHLGLPVAYFYAPAAEDDALVAFAGLFALVPAESRPLLQQIMAGMAGRA